MSVETIDPKSVIITEDAKAHLIAQIQNTNKSGVRLLLKPSGCAGFAYDWNLVEEVLSDDISIGTFGAYHLYTNDISKNYLAGSKIVLKNEGIQGTSLEVVSPLVIDACGCGESVRFDDNG